MTRVIDLDYIITLYEKYAEDLLKVRRLQTVLYCAHGYKTIQKSKPYRVFRYFLKFGLELKKGLFIIQCLETENIPYFTPSAAKNKRAYFELINCADN